MVKFTKQYRHAISDLIYRRIQACNASLNLLRNVNLQYLIKFAKEYKPAIPGQIC